MRGMLALLVLAALAVAACGDDGPRPLSEDTVRRIVQEETSDPLSTDAVRQITREEVERALAARDAAAAAECDISNAAARALPSVVEVVLYRPGTVVRDGSGTGFVALSGGIILTAAHVVRDYKQAEVVTTDGRRIPAEVIKADPALDLAVLRAADRRLPPVRWADTNAIVLGEPVRIVGFPGNRTGVTVTGGVLANRVPPSPTQREELITDSDADHGNSGGPLLTACGEVLGVVVKRNVFVTTTSTVVVGAATALPFALSVAGSATPAPSPAP